MAVDIETEIGSINGGQGDITNWYMSYFRKLRALSYGSGFHFIRRLGRLIGFKPKGPQSLIVERAT